MSTCYIALTLALAVILFALCYQCLSLVDGSSRQAACCYIHVHVHVRVYLCRDVVAGDLETAECRLDDAYANCEKEKNLRYVYTSDTYM